MNSPVPSQQPSPDSTVSLSRRGPAGGEFSLPYNFGRYVLRQRLGGGAMGTVYRAHDTLLDLEVALKIPHAELLCHEHALDRFLIEARAAARLRHPYLCAVLDVGQIDGTHYLTMDYIAGIALSKWKGDGPRAVALLVRKLTQGMAAAHRAGIVHRDLKPANILVTEHDDPVVADFGLALILDNAQTRLTHQGDLLGTPLYMAPEQIQGDLVAIGPSCDVYALGMILYGLLTGQAPFSRKGNAYQLLQRQLHQAPTPPSQHQPGLDPSLERTCLKALARRCEDRFAGMEEFGAALYEYLGTQPAPAEERRREPALGGQRPLVPRAAVRFAFAGYGEGAPPQIGFKDRLYLDVGNGLRPGVLDHHQLATASGSTASLVLGHPDLVDAAVRPARAADAPFLMVLHEHPDLDGVAAAYLAQAYLTTGEFPPAAQALAHYVDKVDAGALGMTLANPFSLYAAHLQLVNRATRQAWNSGQERWQACVQASLEVMAYVLQQVVDRGAPLPDIDAFACPGRFGADDRLEVKADILRYERKMSDPRTQARPVRLRLPSQFGGRVEVEGLLVRDVQNPGDPDRCLFFKDWARSDPIRCPNRKGFVALSVFHSEGEGQPRRCILSVTPGSGASLQGLGAALEEAESASRQRLFVVDDRVLDPTTGETKLPRPGYANADPWYDGRSHDYTIVDSPRSGTLLTAEEIEAIFLEFGK